MKKSVVVVAVFLIACALVLWTMRSPAARPGGSAPAAAAEIRGGPNPFLHAALNVRALVQEVRQRVSDLKDRPGTTAWLDTLERLEIESVELALYRGKDGVVSPILSAPDAGGKIWKRLPADPLLSAFLEAGPDGSLRPAWDRVAGAEGVPASCRTMECRWAKDRLVAAESQVLEALARGEIDVPGSLAWKLEEKARKGGSLASVGACIPQEIPAFSPESLGGQKLLHAHPMGEMLARVTGSLAQEVSELLQGSEGLGLSFRFEGSGERRLSYVHAFQEGAAAVRAHQALTGKDESASQVSEFLAGILGVLGDEGLGKEILLEGRVLGLQLQWRAESDQVLGRKIAQATLGYVFSKSMATGFAGGMDPTPGPVQTVYTRAPDFQKKVEAKAIEQALREQLPRRFFPQTFWDQGDEPRMTLEVDPVAIPNAALAEVNYEILEVRTQDGAEVARKEVSAGSARIDLAAESAGMVQIPVAKGIPGESLKSANLRLTARLPVTLALLEFRAGETPDTAKRDGPVTVTLQRLEKDVAAVRVRGGEDAAQLHAFDASGKAIARRTWMGGGGSASAQFSGVIDRLVVAVPAKMHTVSLTVEVNLNGGRAAELPQEPADVPERFTLVESTPYRSVRPDELAGLEVRWNENAGGFVGAGLGMDLPGGVSGASATWEVSAFGEKSPLVLNGFAMFSGARALWQAQKGMEEARAFFGAVELKIPTAIETFSFPRGEEEEWQTRRTAKGSEIRVRFRKNEVTLASGSLNILDARALNASGRALKAGFQMRSDSEGTYRNFWGQPARFDLVVSGESLKKRLPFEIVRGELDREAFARYRERVKEERQVVRALQMVEKAFQANWTGYGEDIAGLHYLLDRQGRPGSLIPKEIAHACPEGAQRFGYTVSPYCGYTFSSLVQAVREGKKTGLRRADSPKEFAWEGGKFQVQAMLERPGVAARPADPARPTFLVFWGSVYQKMLGAESLEAMPESPWNEEWAQVQVLENE